jgi:hypothetical protein
MRDRESWSTELKLLDGSMGGLRQGIDSHNTEALRLLAANKGTRLGILLCYINLLRRRDHFPCVGEKHDIFRFCPDLYKISSERFETIQRCS